MRISRMNGLMSVPGERAYGVLARLKIALPLVQAAASSGSKDPETTILTLIDLTRDLTDRLANSTFQSLERLDADRRERLLRSIAQDVAYLVGRAHERGTAIDASKLIAQVQLAQSSIDRVPGARLNPFFEETLSAQAQWQLAVARASARLVESLMIDPSFAREHAADVLKDLLDRVETCGGLIKTASPEEHRTVRLSLLGQFAKAHSRLIHERVLGAITSGNRPQLNKLISTIDSYHHTLGVALGALVRAELQATTGLAPETGDLEPAL